MRPSAGLVGLVVALAAPAVLAQNDDALPNLSTLSQPDGQGTSATSTAATTAAATTQTSTSASASSSSSSSSSSTTATATTDSSEFPTVTQGNGIHLSGLPTLAGVGIPNQKVPDTAKAPFMQKSNLPDGTVFICVGAILGFLGMCVLLWRALVAWSLHRSVKRAAMAQNAADIKAMTTIPGRKRGMYNVVGANSTVSLDHLSAAPPGTSRPSKPPGATTVRPNSSLFFSPTAGGAAGLHNPGNRSSSYLPPGSAAGLHNQGNRSSSYLPAGYYATGTAALSSSVHVGGHPSTNSLAIPSSRSGISPPTSPSLPPSRGYERSPHSRDGVSMYNRNSVATLGAGQKPLYGADNVSQISLNLPGGTATGGRAPSAYLDDLFENHNGRNERERF